MAFTRAVLELFWKSTDVVKLLAIVVILAWLATIFLHLTGVDQTLTNVVMIIVGFFYGSSTGSKKKDEAIFTETKDGKPS